MPGNIRTTKWRTRDGKWRRVRLYEVWCNLQGRLAGGKSMRPHYWHGIRNEFFDWQSFRRWALRNGYRKGMSLDRINEYKDYAPDNCQFLTVSEHCRKSTETRERKRGHNAGCMCRACVERRAKMPKHIKLPIEIDQEVGF